LDLGEETTLIKVAGDCRFTEGPAADSEGNVFFSDSPLNRILVLRGDGSVSVWKEPSGRANGMNFDREGRLVTCCAQGEGGARAVHRYERDGSVTILASHFQGQRLNSPNDLCFDPTGRIYFTDPRYGDQSDVKQDAMAVYRIEENGDLSRVIDDVETPNGIVMTPDGKTIYLVDNNPVLGGARTLLAYGRDARSGTWLRKAEIFDFGTERGGDGMVLDVSGNIYLTAGAGDTAGVYVFSAEGENFGFLPIPETPTNCTFGGPELTTLYITATSSVYAVECSFPGYLAFPVVSRPKFEGGF
jgi:gluconolactonase